MGKIKTFSDDFKKFISQGNILDMAVGVVVGTAFKAIVSSLVADVIMPCIGFLLGDVNFTDLKWVLVEAVAEVVNEEGAVVTPAVAEVAVKYGQFIQYIIDFLIIAFTMFIVVKVAMSFRNKLEAKKKAEEEAKAAAEAAAKAAEEAAKAAIPAEPTVEEKTLSALEDIRDYLKGMKN